jgi:2,5-diketo-D-gluconate reductase A
MSTKFDDTLAKGATHKFTGTREPLSPEARSGRGHLDENERLHIAAKHGQISAQIVSRQYNDRGRSVTPRSVTPERVGENIDLFDFKPWPANPAQINELN